jgi:hypothetical protein
MTILEQELNRITTIMSKKINFVTIFLQKLLHDSINNIIIDIRMKLHVVKELSLSAHRIDFTYFREREPLET